MGKIKVAILASGSGTNAENLFRHQGQYYDVVKILTDNSQAGVIARMKNLGEDVLVVPLKKGETRVEHESRMLSAIGEGVDLICLAGYRRILTPYFLNHFTVINIHPSLLPLHPGLGAFEKTFKANDPKGGVSVHYVDEGMDTGEVILQKAFPRFANDSFQEFEARGRMVEQELYPQALINICRQMSEVQS